jgi:CheY-like chemotaxis protein
MVKAPCILLIDKENAIRELAQLCLETVAGWEVLTAESGSEVIVKAGTKQVDAILLDLNAIASARDWSKIFQQLQKNPTTQHIPVILLTTTVPTNELSQFTNLGVTAAIAKPFDLLTLASQVAAALGWQL